MFIKKTCKTIHVIFINMYSVMIFSCGSVTEGLQRCPRRETDFEALCGVAGFSYVEDGIFSESKEDIKRRFSYLMI